MALQSELSEIILSGHTAQKVTSQLIASKRTYVLVSLTYSVCRGHQCPPHVPAAVGRSVDDTSGWPAPEESVHPRKHTHHKQTAITTNQYFPLLTG